MENHPEFARTTSAQTLDEIRQSAIRRHCIINAQQYWTTTDVLL